MHMHDNHPFADFWQQLHLRGQEFLALTISFQQLLVSAWKSVEVRFHHQLQQSE